MAFSSYFKNQTYVRNFVFGVEDSVVSTVGLVSGIAAAQVSPQTVVLVGVVLIFVEAFSMAVGSILSDHTVQEMNKQAGVPFKKSFSAGVIMFISYLVSGFLVLLPYFIFAPSISLIVSILIAFGVLIVLGMVGNRVSGTRSAGRIIKTVLIGGAAVAIGIIVGLFFKI